MVRLPVYDCLWYEINREQNHNSYWLEFNLFLSNKSFYVDDGILINNLHWYNISSKSLFEISIRQLN